MKNVYIAKTALVLPELVAFLVRNRFTVREAEALLSRDALDAVLNYIFYIQGRSHVSHS